MTHQTNLIDINNLIIRRNSFTLSIPEFHLEPGKILGLVGPNAAGKTTLLESIAGLRTVQSGEISVFSRNPWKEPEFVRSRLGFMYDTMPLFALRIGALLNLLSGYYKTWDAKLVTRLLERFNLDPAQKIHRLSRGQGTRIRLVIAMAFQPDLLILDEPASGLDLEGRQSLLKSVLEIVQDPNRSVIISSHGLNDVERISDQLLVLNKGSIIKTGNTSDLVGDGNTLEEMLVKWGAAK